MTKLISFVVVGALAVLVLFFSTPTTTNNEYLRIHIRANSNLTIDQNVKFQVKDAVVDFMIPLLSNCETKAESINIVSNNLSKIEQLSTNVLKEHGFSYCATAQIKTEEFPARSYGDLTLESGFYDALILNLGTGEGNNWWCVVYPPLCFVNGSTEVSMFKSRILEIIDKFF